jgi:hypothetical protein
MLDHIIMSHVLHSKQYHRRFNLHVPSSTLIIQQHHRRYHQQQQQQQQHHHYLQ